MSERKTKRKDESTPRRATHAARAIATPRARVASVAAAGRERRALGARLACTNVWVWPATLALLFAVALMWRLAYIRRLALTPLGGSLIEDAQFYWNWAGYLLRHGFLGARPFFLAPLYPYLLALLRIPLGDSVPAMLHVQALWGAAAVVLIADAARRLTRPGVGLAVGVLAAFYESAVFFDGLVLMESLLFFLESLLLWWIVARGMSATRWKAAAIAGVLIGLITEGRATSALLLLPAAAWLIAVARGRAVRAAAALAAGFLLVTAPVAIRNLAVGHEWIPFTYNFGFNLYAGYNPEANGGFTSITATHRASSQTEELMESGAQADGREFLRKVEGVDLTPAASSAYWTQKAWAWMRAHPGQALALSGRKLVMMWNRDEYAQIENVNEFREVAGPLGVPFLGTFFFVGALAFAGVLLSCRRRATFSDVAVASGAGAAVDSVAPALRFAIGYLIVMTLSIVPFFVTDRYRHHLIPAALLLAAVTLERSWAAYRARAVRTARPLAAAIALGFLIVNLPAPHLGSTKYAWGLAADLGQRWAHRGRPDLAAAEYERAIALEKSGALARLPGSTAATERSDLYYDYGNALGRLGQRAEAVAAYERAVSEAPDRAQAVRALADAYATIGRTAQADSLYATLPSKVGGDGLAAGGRAWSAARAGHFAAAESLFAIAVQSDPTLEDAWGGLIRLQVQRDDRAAAHATLERARRAGLAGAPLAGHEALLAALEGRRADAERLLAEIPASALTADATLEDVVKVTRGILGRMR